MYAHTLVSYAGDLIAAAPAPDVLAAPKTIPQVIDGLKLWIMGILAAVATLFLVIGSLRYMTAGDPAQTEQAKGNFKGALAGYALAVLSPVFLQVLQSILGG